MANLQLLSVSTRISLGQPQAFRNLTVVPLLDPVAPPTGWLTLGRALAGGLVEVSEISEHGSVPQLRLLNRGSEPVFLLDGEELVGAKQNRILNISLLAPAGGRIEIPVSCVEQGRWSWRTRRFGDSERVIYSKLRARNCAFVSASVLREGSSRGDQGRVWNDIALKSMRMGVCSDTGAAAALYERYSADVDGFVGGIVAQPGQVGAAFLVDGRFAGLDLFGGPDLLKDLLPRLVRSYALDAVESESQVEYGTSQASTNQASVPLGDDEARSAVSRVLDSVARLDCDRGEPVGVGESLRLSGRDLAGASLVGPDGFGHLSLWVVSYG
jgi:hypothetical protein